jgi:hypothetical protein
LDRRLYKATFKSGPNTIEMSHFTEAGRWRFGLTEKKDEPVGLHPILPEDPKDLAPHMTSPKPKKPKMRLRGVVELHRELPHRHFEGVID